MTLRIGTRRSRLAIAQTQIIAELLRQVRPEVQVELQEITTEGDRRQAAPPTPSDSKAAFTAELSQALVDDRIDLAVHSAKDLPVEQPPELCVGCVPPRLVPNDALISDTTADVQTLPNNALVGTSSLRRAAQLLSLRPDLQIVPLRGNIDTRIGKVRAGECQATLLAVAGLQRAGLADQAAQVIPVDLILPAPGQAALAVECRRDRDDLLEMLRPIQHEPSALELAAERLLVVRLGVGCRAPLGALARSDAAHLTLTAALFTPDGARCCRANHQAPIDQVEHLVEHVVAQLHRQGAAEVLALC